MTVGDIFEYLNELFPCSTAADFDNVGLLIGDFNARVSRALVTLDCSSAALEQAECQGCELIITHHPVIFSPLKTVTADDFRYRLIKSGISVVSMHTNMDIAENGVSDCLAKAIGLSEICPFTAEDGFVLRTGELEAPVSADDLALKLRRALGGFVRYSDGNRLISKVLVCSGSGGEFIREAVSYGAQALVTAEVKHHSFYEAAECGISVFDAGHFNTEDVVTEPLKSLLQVRFPEAELIAYHGTVVRCV